MTPPAAVSPPKENTTKPTTVCHWLPCNMDYDGMAPVHQYFAEQALPESNNVRAAQLRGRGLLSVVNTTYGEEGVVLTFHSNGDIQKQASFQELREWHHEHSIPAVKRAQSQLQTANDWCQVARAVRQQEYICLSGVESELLTYTCACFLFHRYTIRYLWTMKNKRSGSRSRCDAKTFLK